MSSMFVELQTPLNEYSLVCRGCLADSGEMKNITEWGLTEDFCKLTNVVLHSVEGISELLCTVCEDRLMACKRFVTQCQQSDITLRNVAEARDETQLQEIANSIKYTFNENEITYTIFAPDTESKIHLPCPYKCEENYIKKKDLLHHLIKKHKTPKSYSITIRYYCHIKKCSYNNVKFFNLRKALNQHVNKVHKEKVFQCDNCKASFPLITDYNRHLRTCNFIYKCDVCNISYNMNERLLVHLMRHHPELHKQYKERKKAERRSQMEPVVKKPKVENFDFLSSSPKRSFATQTLANIKNDVSLSWQKDLKTDEISTQTVFEDSLSLKSQSEDDSLFLETVSLSDIQTQTFPLEFGLSRLNKETLTEPVSIKETQTCVCLFDSKPNNCKLFDNLSSPCNYSNYISTETQTLENSCVTDVLLSFNSAETQTCFDEDLQKCL